MGAAHDHSKRACAGRQAAGQPPNAALHPDGWQLLLPSIALLMHVGINELPAEALTRVKVGTSPVRFRHRSLLKAQIPGAPDVGAPCYGAFAYEPLDRDFMQLSSVSTL
jgi:hypothetical protein